MIQTILKTVSNFTAAPKRGIRILLHSNVTPEFRALLYRILIIVLSLSIIITCEGVALWLVSGGIGTSVPTPAEGIYLIVINIFGEIVPTSSAIGRALTLLALIQGLILATYLITVFAFFTIRGSKFMTHRHNDHFIICGWNFQAPRILQELINARSKQHFDIVVIPGYEIPKELDEFSKQVYVVPGLPTEDRTLQAADISDAKSAIILTDPTLQADDADAKVLMITLAVETLNPSVYTCAQLMNSENTIHLMRANVDEVVPFDVIGANLSVASAVNPGITRLFRELIHFDDGSEFYKLAPPIPSVLVGKSFRDALSWFADKDMILVGVESNELKDSYQEDNSYDDHSNSTNIVHRGVYVNPKDYRIQNDDALFVIADDAPDASVLTAAS